MLPTAHIRQVHTSIARLVRRIGRNSNPGLGHQLTGIENAEEIAVTDPEGLGDLETDFMDVHISHREHEKQMQQQREYVRHQMIKHKYFREPKLPNLLTYAEKEQMRLLHARDPDEWSAERLAESFPSTTAIVEKILKANWRPKDKERVRKHDEVVMRNWEEFRRSPDKLQLPPSLKEHLQRFADRRPADIRIPAEDWMVRPKLPSPQHKEFVSIITSCSKYKDSKAEQLKLNAPKKSATIEQTAATEDPENETYLLEEVRDKRIMRLQELKQIKLSPQDLSASNVVNCADEQTEQKSNSLELMSVETLQNPSGTGVLPAVKSTSDWNLATQKYETTEIVISAEDQQRYEITRAKDRVYIPRKLWRKGGTFRVEDCYYDDDGEFLYRVPGMTGQTN